MSSTDYVPGRGNVRIRNTADYAQVHNEGANIPVIPKMKKFFWAKHYEAGGGVKGKDISTSSVLPHRLTI